MSRALSIEAMRLGLDEAVSHDDLQRARRYIDRLKGIVIDSLMQDDPVAIRLAGNALRQSGERLELFADQPMVFDKAALAWQLRAEAGTAALAEARERCSKLGVRAVSVEVGAENAVAQSVYRRTGFAMTDRRTELDRWPRRPAAAHSEQGDVEVDLDHSLGQHPAVGQPAAARHRPLPGRLEVSR